MNDSNRDATTREGYDKKHVGGCRKLMYDPVSSPCTCDTEYERERLRADASERWSKALAERNTSLQAAVEWAAGELLKAEKPIAALGLFLEAAGLQFKVTVAKTEAVS